MRVISLEQFLGDLPKFVSDINNVVIATYNNLRSCEEGGEFNANGKKVTVLCGGAAYAHVNGAMNPRAQDTKKAGVKVVWDALISIEAGTLVVLYAGKSRFGEVLAMAYRLAGRDVKVALVSCGCDNNVFDGLAANPNITCVVPMNESCNGGRGDLSVIFEALTN
jgi:hypothetical protein